MGPSLAVEGPTTREVFEAYVDRVLAPDLRPGQIVVMDNLSAHKGSRIRELIERRGCQLRYLPPYSPDLKTLSRRPSRRLKGCCAGRRLVAGKLSLRRWRWLYLRSVPAMPRVSLSIAGTAYWSNSYDKRSNVVICHPASPSFASSPLSELIAWGDDDRERHPEAAAS